MIAYKESRQSQGSVDVCLSAPGGCWGEDAACGFDDGDAVGACGVAGQFVVEG